MRRILAMATLGAVMALAPAAAMADDNAQGYPNGGASTPNVTVTTNGTGTDAPPELGASNSVAVYLQRNP